MSPDVAARLPALRGARLVLASHNPGKLREFRGLLRPLEVVLVSAGALGLEEPEESGASFAANARIKALAAARASGLAALADDSGLTVAGLGGAPGIHSARWAGPGRDFAVAMRRIHDELEARFGRFERADRRAAFVCVLALAWPDGTVATFEGRVEGELVWPPRGEGGFGYDPMFAPAGEVRTFAEMSPAEKARHSHRARAVAALLQAVAAAERAGR